MSCNFQIFWIIQQNCLTTIWIISTILMTTTTEKTVGEIIYRVDPLALLSATLRTYQKAVCDTEQVVLTCPRGTSISIEVAQYSKQDDGFSIDELCPLDDKASGILTSKQIQLGQNNTSDFGNSSNNDNNNNNSPNDIVPENCMWPNALQYSLLQTVVEACQKKKHCKFNATPGTYGVGASGVGDNTGSSSYHNTNIELDPCPRVRKFVEIAYKCRPYEFRSKLACENDIIQLECNPYSRIAIYSASFGRTEYESIQCPQPQGVREETCLASYATETVMQICHGRRKCNLAADANTFGSPCHRNSRMYLKVVYTCVPKKVLKDRYESISEPDEREDFDGDINDLYEDDQFFKESEAIPKLQSNLTRVDNTTTTLIGNSNINGTNLTTNNYEILSSSANPIITQSQEINYIDDRERIYFLLLLAGTIFFVLCIIIVAARLIIQKKRNRTMSQEQNISSTKGETTISNGFDDSISEIDTDIDLTVQQIRVPSVSKNENYITYGPTSSLYSSLGPSNISQTSSTMLFQPSANSLICPSKQSPDIIGVTNKYMHGGTLAQTSHNNCGMGTIIPISSMSQYSTAPTSSLSTSNFNDTSLRRPESSFIQQQIITSTQSPKHIQQHQTPHSIVVLQCTGPQQQQQETFHYDGTAPRTLSTGVAQNSQFYYG